MNLNILAKIGDVLVLKWDGFWDLSEISEAIEDLYFLAFHQL